MVIALICTKESRRFPGKNNILLPYTLAWLGMAQLYLPGGEELRIVSAGVKRPESLPRGIMHLSTPAGEPHHECVLRAMCACPHTAETVWVLPQLTQPVRRVQLLSEVVEAGRTYGFPASTYTEQRLDGWRGLGARGQDDVLRYSMDGRLYAWQTEEQLAAIFAHRIPAWVNSRDRSGLVDIDAREDMPPGLAGMVSHQLFDI